MGTEPDSEDRGGMNATTDSDPAQNPDPPNDPRPQQPPQPPPPVRWLRRDTESPIAGVATGLATYFGVTPILLQIAFIATTAFNGFGALAYIAGWLLIPRPSDPETRPVTITSDTVRAVFGVLFAIGAVSSALTFGPNSFEVTLLPLILIGGGFYLLNQRDQATVASPPPPSASPSPSQAVVHWADIDTAPQQPVPSEPPGPPVTSVTLAAVAVAIGLMVTIGQFGLTVPATATFGVAMTVLGAGLIYGAFFGRPRGLVPIGLLLLIGLAVSPAVDAFSEGGTGTREYSPVTQAAVLDNYDLGAGPLELDLRRVNFTEDQTITVNVGAGYAEIWIPDDINVIVDAEASAGYVEVFGREYAGVFANGEDSRAAADADRPTVTLVVDVTFGYAEVRRG